jgi:hypothetical protein
MAKGKPDPNWKERVSEWQKSGKSLRAWCQENKIPVTTFYGWRNRLKKPNGKTKQTTCIKAKAEFIELKDKKSDDSGVILECGGVKIYLKAEFDPLILRQCVDYLRGAPC